MTQDRPGQTIYTIGHSTRSLAELVEMLQSHDVRTLTDVRAFPGISPLPPF